MKAKKAIVIIKNFLGFGKETQDYEEATIKEAVESLDNFVNSKKEDDGKPEESVKVSSDVVKQVVAVYNKHRARLVMSEDLIRALEKEVK